MSFSWERATPERRKAVEDMSSQDWVSRIQKLRSYNANLETEYELLQQQYQKSQVQKEYVRKKARELADVMSTVYHRYEEMEKVIQQRDRDILHLHEVISDLEGELHRVKGDQVGKDRSVSLDESLVSTDQQLLEGTTETLATTSYYYSHSSTAHQIELKQAHIKIHELEVTLQDSENRELKLVEECSKLKARIVELEGSLTGTLFHTAYRSPLRITEQDMAPFTPNYRDKTRDDVQKMIDALKAITHSNANTPNVTPSRNIMTTSNGNGTSLLERSSSSIRTDEKEGIFQLIDELKESRSVLSAEEDRPADSLRQIVGISDIHDGESDLGSNSSSNSVESTER